jgi:hypothetical protein
MVYCDVVQIRLLKDGDVPMLHWVTLCPCCGPFREYPDRNEWHLRGEVLDPEDLYNEIELVAHKDTFKFGENYEIIAYP